ncbi:hypothetical protein ABT061_43355 [Streptosporangium sp. NPDC002544]|uniref:hypothetical protein n=1 Tax=Streptosporangium sp. NPDC002544 TaxID=3154538 RepID=UPI00331928FD
MSTDTLPSATPDLLRADMVATLKERGSIRSPQVEAAFAAVPRERFAPEASLEAAYSAQDVVVTKRGPNGRATSSISAPWLQAEMLETAQLTPGAKVLEVGSVLWSVQLLQGRLTNWLAKITIRDGLATPARNRALDNASVRCREGLVPLR